MNNLNRPLQSANRRGRCRGVDFFETIIMIRNHRLRIFLFLFVWLPFGGCGDRPEPTQTVDAIPPITADYVPSDRFLNDRALNGDRSERAVAIRVLLNDRTPQAMATLSKAYEKEPDRFLRRALLDGLSGFVAPDTRTDARAVAQRGLKDKDEVVQVVAARTLTLTAADDKERAAGIKELKRRSREDESNPEPSDLAKKFLQELNESDV